MPSLPCRQNTHAGRHSTRWRASVCRPRCDGPLTWREVVCRPPTSVAGLRREICVCPPYELPCEHLDFSVSILWLQRCLDRQMSRHASTPCGEDVYRRTCDVKVLTCLWRTKYARYV